MMNESISRPAPVFIRRTLIFRALIATCFLTVSSFAQGLAPDEQKLVKFVDANIPAAISFLEKTVNVSSPTEDLAGVKEVGSLFAKEFESLGMTVKWIDMPADSKRAGHLIAETNGSKGKRLLLLGHLDTVLKGERFRREDDKVFGTGVGDMKGGNVVLLYALKALHSAGLLKDTRITVLLTGDEEDACEPVTICRGDMVGAAKRSDLALSFEGTVRNTATVGRRGASSWTLEVEAKTGHSSQIFRESMETARSLRRLEYLMSFASASATRNISRSILHFSSAAQACSRRAQPARRVEKTMSYPQK